MLENQVRQNNKIRIAYIMPTLDRGGAERALLDLILNLDLNIYSPYLILFKGSGPWITELENRNIPAFVLKKRFKIDFHNFRQILKVMKEINPLIVHTQLGGDLYGRLAAKILKIPVIISTEQNLNPDESFITNILKRITCRFALKIVAISEAVKKDMIYRYNISENKINIIPNGIEIKKFIAINKKTRESGDKKIILGTIGRLVPQKGHEILIRALLKIKDLKFECLIAGRGSYEIKLRKLIKERKLEDRVRLVGAVDNVPNFLSSLDAFIFPSLWEGQGIVLLEAALSELPIIASKVDGIKELLNDNNSYLVKAGDPKDLAAKITWLINNIDEETVKNRTIKLKNEVIAKYSDIKMADDYQLLYQELINNYENTAS